MLPTYRRRPSRPSASSSTTPEATPAASAPTTTPAMPTTRTGQVNYRRQTVNPAATTTAPAMPTTRTGQVNYRRQHHEYGALTTAPGGATQSQTAGTTSSGFPRWRGKTRLSEIKRREEQKRNKPLEAPLARVEIEPLPEIEVPAVGAITSPLTTQGTAPQYPISGIEYPGPGGGGGGGDGGGGGGGGGGGYERKPPQWYTNLITWRF